MKQIDIAARNRRIVQMAREGKTAQEIADFFHLTKARVLSLLRCFKIKAERPNHTLESEKALKIVEELKAGMRQIDIAKKMGVSRQYVHQIKNKWENS